MHSYFVGTHKKWHIINVKRGRWKKQIYQPKFRTQTNELMFKICRKLEATDTTTTTTPTVSINALMNGKIQRFNFEIQSIKVKLHTIKTDVQWEKPLFSKRYFDIIIFFGCCSKTLFVNLQCKTFSTCVKDEPTVTSLVNKSQLIRTS